MPRVESVECDRARIQQKSRRFHFYLTFAQNQPSTTQAELSVRSVQLCVQLCVKKLVRVSLNLFPEFKGRVASVEF